MSFNVAGAASINVAIDGVGFYADGIPDWNACVNVLTNAEVFGSVKTKPAPSMLAPNERRRAPDAVLLALDVAEQACKMAQQTPRDLPNIFASAYGDLVISDYLCDVLARDALELSPTKFHNSVHNAPAGYWTISAGCMRASSAVAAGPSTFAAGLLEAALLVAIEGKPVLYAAFDVAAVGALRDVVSCAVPLGVALVLAPPHSGAPLLRLSNGNNHVAVPLAAQAYANSLDAALQTNPIAAALPFLRVLARREPANLGLGVSRTAATPHNQGLNLEISF